MNSKDPPFGHSPLPGSASPEICTKSAFVLSLLGDKWSVRVIVRLSAGTLRFNEIKRLVGGISQRVLTSTLRNLEREGLVHRTVHPTVPPRVEYQLSDLGRSLWTVVYPLGEWAAEHMNEIHAARARFDQAR
ncbi:helix-turn-helix domain-containing protein [Paraburkholderia sediminicola]|uniref:winged helix-turn-helix transcriptional regulator n=1 Tax=Paraburkholderia sediminicola TaxID=458836 RepID=UPI0038BB4F8D